MKHIKTVVNEVVFIYSLIVCSSNNKDDGAFFQVDCHFDSEHPFKD